MEKNTTIKIREKLNEFAVLALFILLFFLLFPLAFGVLLAYMIAPIPTWLNKKLRIPYILAIIIVFIIIFAILSKIISLFIQSIIVLSPILLDKFKVLRQLLYDSNIMIPFIEEATTLLEGSLSHIISYISASINHIFKITLFAFAFLFALFESKSNRYWFFVIVPKKYRNNWQHIFSQGTQIFNYFLFVELVLFSVTFILLTIFFYSLQVPFYIHVAFLLTLADLLPILGLGLFFIPIIIFFIVKQKFAMSILFISVYILLIIVRQLIDSKLWASTFHIRTIYSFLIGAASVLLFGFWGLLLSPIFMLLLIRLKNNKNYF